MQITADDVAALALGCELLGSGGGGSPSAAQLILAHQLARSAPVRVEQELPPSAHVACVGAVGSAALMLEDLPGPSPFVRAVDAIRRHGTPVNAVLALEMGGVNGLLAPLAASALGLPLVDADPHGRAYTRLDRSVLGASIPMTALAFANSAGETVYVEARDGAAIERMVRAILPAAGGWGAVACFAGRADAVVSRAVAGSVSRALALGAALSAAMGGNPAELLGRPDTREAFEGIVTEEMSWPGVEVGGVASLRHAHRPSVARLDFSNEYVALYADGDLVAAAPDIICALDASTWRPIPVDRLTAGQRVRLLVIDAPPELALIRRATGDFGLPAHGFAEAGAPV